MSTSMRLRSDNINVHELGDMLRYLGFSVGTDHLYMLLAQVPHSPYKAMAMALGRWT